MFHLSDNIASIKEVSNYASFLKYYREEFYSVLGKLNENPEFATIHSVSFNFLMVVFL